MFYCWRFTLARAKKLHAPTCEWRLEPFSRSTSGYALQLIQPQHFCTLADDELLAKFRLLFFSLFHLDTDPSKTTHRKILERTWLRRRLSVSQIAAPDWDKTHNAPVCWIGWGCYFNPLFLIVAGELHFNTSSVSARDYAPELSSVAPNLFAAKAWAATLLAWTIFRYSFNSSINKRILRDLKECPETYVSTLLRPIKSVILFFSHFLVVRCRTRNPLSFSCCSI